MKGTIKVMDRTGHSTTEFDFENKESTTAAKVMAERLENQRHILYKVEGPGQATQIKKGTYDPSAHSDVLAVPPMVGG